MIIIVLAGGSDQIALIEELKHRGHEIVLVDYHENPVAKPFADKHIVASTLDMDAVRRITQQERAAYVVTACTDQALLTMASVSEELGFPSYISYDTALNVTNKLYMKEKLTKWNIPTSKHITTQDPQVAIPEDFDYPLVVKPCDCNSSKGVKKCCDEQSLRDNLRVALSLSRTHTAVIEEYKSGREISADFFIKDEEAIFLCATRSDKVKNVDSFTITRSYFPVLANEQEKQVTAIGQRIAEAFGLRNSPMFVQLIITDDNKIFVLEFSARMGGGSKYKLIEAITGVDIMKIFVDLVFDESFVINPFRKTKVASMNYVYCKNGIFRELRGFDGLCHFQYAEFGTAISKVETSSDRIAGFLLTANTDAELIEKTQAANASIQVLDDDGDDIARHDLIGGGS